jgi:hypothetical protein
LKVPKKHKKLPVGKKITAMTKAPQGLSISEFSADERAKLARPIEVCDAFLNVVKPNDSKNIRLCHNK